MRLLILPALLLTACSPSPETTAPASPPAPAAASGPRATPAADVVPGPNDVAYKILGWDGTRLTLRGAATGTERPFTGVTTKFSKAGHLEARYEVKDGVYHGQVEEWYDNGQQLTRAGYADGKHEGDNFYWNRDGTLQSHKVWKNGEKVSETPGRLP